MGAAFASNWRRTQSYDNAEEVFGVAQLPYGQVFVALYNRERNMNSLLYTGDQGAEKQSQQSHADILLEWMQYNKHRLPSNVIPAY